MVTITRQTMELFLKEFHYVELMALYSYYKYIAEEQGTNKMHDRTSREYFLLGHTKSKKI